MDKDNDWRNKPRIGKSQFMRCITEINEKVKICETHKQIYDALKSDNKITLSYSQFNRYMTDVFGKKNKSLKNSILKENIIEKKNDVDITPGNITDEKVFENNITISEWHSVNVTRLSLIERLEKYGFKPNDVKEWKLSNDTQISKKLTEILIKGTK